MCGYRVYIFKSGPFKILQFLLANSTCIKYKAPHGSHREHLMGQLSINPGFPHGSFRAKLSWATRNSPQTWGYRPKFEPGVGLNTASERICMWNRSCTSNKNFKWVLPKTNWRTYDSWWRLTWPSASSPEGNGCPLLSAFLWPERQTTESIENGSEFDS